MMDYNSGTEQWKDIAVKNYVECLNSAEKGSREYRQLRRGMEILLKYDFLN